jgi:hypothetical protein
MSQIKEATMGLRGIPRFDGQYDKVHIDEKWFNMSRDGEIYILTMDEELPVRRVRHKNYITKVMFLCAQARPRWDPGRRQWWDGKIGIWPIGRFDRAQRSSVHRPAGARVWVNEGVGHEKHKDMLLNCVIPAILEKWLAADLNDPRFQVKIQQDNAKGHCGPNDPDLLQALKELEDNGIIQPGKIKFYAQPPHSPDLNLCDLGLFAAVQAAYYVHSPRNDLELIDMVQRSYAEYPANKINRIWVTLMSIFNCVMETHGDNNYKIPHMNKERMEREGTLPRELEVSQEAYHTIPVDNPVDNPPPNDNAPINNNPPNNNTANIERGTDSSDDNDESDNWSMDTEESVIFRKVEADLEAELKAREDDSDSDEEASTNSNHSLSPEDLAYYKQVEADMLKEGTL